MKNNKKDSVRISETARGAVNLRRDVADRGIWRRAGLPRKVDDAGRLPFARFSPFGDGREICLLLGAGNKLYYRLTGGEAVLLATLPAAPLLAVTAAEGMVRLLLSHKPDQYLTYDKELRVTFHGEMPRLPAIKLVAADYNTLYGQVPAIRLSGGSTGASGSQLCAADNRMLADALVGTYDSLRQRAKGLRYCVQPVMARYRLLDAAGTTVAVGPTVPLSIVDGFSATGSIVQTSSDSMQTLSEGRIEMGVYRPGVIAPAKLPAPWDRLVSRLIVEVTDEIEPLTPDGSTPHGVHRDTQSGVVAVTSRLPGFSTGTALDKGRLRRLGIDWMTAPTRVVAEFSNPFGGGIGQPGATVTLSITSSSPALPSSASHIGPEECSWSAALEAGDLTILCNPLRKSRGGWSPDCFVASREAATGNFWRLATSVLLSTPAGEIRVRNETTGNGNAPTSLSAALSYPSEDATEMTVTYLSPTGTVYEESFPLTPLPGAGISCHVSSGMERVRLTKTVEAYLPKGSEPPSRLEEGTAETYPTADLGRLIDSRHVCAPPVRAVKVAPRSGSGWDFSRLKLLFFGEAGTILATVGDTGKFHSVSPVDHRPVMSADAICEATGATGATMLLYAGEDLISISGQKVTTVVPSIPRLLASRPGFDNVPLRDVAIGWEGHFRETWLSPGSGSIPLLRITADGDLIEARLPGINLLPNTYRFAADGSSLLLATGSATYDLSDEEQAGQLEVMLNRRLRPDSDPGWLTVNIFASSLSGDFTLSGDRGTEIAEPLLRLGFTGAVNAPVTVRLAAPRRAWFETSVRLLASGDLAIHDETFFR